MEKLSRKDALRALGATTNPMHYFKFAEQVNALQAGSGALGGGQGAAERILGEAGDRGLDYKKDPDLLSKEGVRLKTIDAALSARRQQREGSGGSAQSQAVRRALAMAKNRQGGTAGSGDDPGRKNVLGGGL